MIKSKVVKEGEADADVQNKEQTLSSTMVKPLEGSISCLVFADQCDAMADPEMFIGFENGAVGMFKLVIEEGKKGLEVQVIKLFTGQKVIQDPNVKHVLSLASTRYDPTNPDFTLSIGYYSALLQTIKFITGYQDNSYTMMDQTVTDTTYHEKPGIGVITTLRMNNNQALQATGGFDHRIKLVSLKTLKPLVHLTFH